MLRVRAILPQLRLHDLHHCSARQETALSERLIVIGEPPSISSLDDWDGMHTWTTGMHWRGPARNFYLPESRLSALEGERSWLWEKYGNQLQQRGNLPRLLPLPKTVSPSGRMIEPNIAIFCPSCCDFNNLPVLDQWHQQKRSPDAAHLNH
jgi:hypothetical protein